MTDPRPELRPPPDPPRPSERRRAAAYLDLWERQLVHAAAEGEVAPPRRRRDPEP